MKRHLLLVALLLASSAYADSPNPASDLVYAGIAADLGTTAIGLGLGAAEMNPLGFLIVPLKFIGKANIDKMEDQNERRFQTAEFTGIQFGAAAANICTLALGSPPAAALCFLGGMMLGYSNVMAVPTTDDCMNRHMKQLQEAVDTGRDYRVDLATCTGRFVDTMPVYAASSSLEEPH